VGFTVRDMEIIRTPILDLVIFRAISIRDERGYFSRTLDVQALAEAGNVPAHFKQELVTVLPGPCIPRVLN